MNNPSIPTPGYPGESKRRVKGPVKLVLYVVIIALILLGGRWIIFSSGWISENKNTIASVPQKVNLPDAPKNFTTEVPELPLPTSAISTRGVPVRGLCWAWNSQMGQMYSNGGKQTTEGSLMEKYGVRLTLTRQDDVGKMQADLLAFAEDYAAGNRNTDKGVHFVQIMGDGYAAFAAALQPKLLKLGPNYGLKVIGSAGYSRGEDKFMGPEEWKKNPQSMKGGVVAGYLRDGDWNIALKFCGDNQIRNNPNEKTYDPDALNWVAASDYIDACQKYITDYTEERWVVKNGKKTGDKITVKAQAVVTWTPGDVQIAEEKGGLVSIVSTKEYRAQMPNAIIGIDQWCQDNRATVEGMLMAIAEGGDQVKLYPEALQRAGEISTEVYGEKDADYWVKYYKGSKEVDAQGLEIELGGSSVNNLSDMLYLFGLSKGSGNPFKATYEVFGNVVKQQYPELVPEYPAWAEVSDVSYLKGVSRKLQTTSTPEMQKYTSGDITDVTSKRSWTIEFETGQSTFTSDALDVLDQLHNELVITGLKINIFGHTDNTGSDEINMALSKDRANAVKRYLQQRSPADFPSGRFPKVTGKGPNEPIASNETSSGRAKNRRVDITLGN